MDTFSALLALCAGNSPVTGEFPTRRPVARSFDVFFDLRLNKRLSKQSWGWWFETPSRPLWRHCNGLATASCRMSNTGPRHVCCRPELRWTNLRLYTNRLLWWWPSTSVPRTHWSSLCSNQRRILITWTRLDEPFFTMLPESGIYGPSSGLLQKMWTWRPRRRSDLIMCQRLSFAICSTIATDL